MKKLGVCVEQQESQDSWSPEWEGASEGDGAGGRGEARPHRASWAHGKDFEFYPLSDGRLLAFLEGVPKMPGC